MIDILPTKTWRWLGGLTLLAVLSPAAYSDEPAPPECDPPGKAISPKPICADGWMDTFYDDLQTFKKDWHFPVSVGAWNWEHINSGGPNRTGYGIPPEQNGTYFYYIDVDPNVTFDCGEISKIGMHSQIRLRDQEDFRQFYPHQIWTWELYGFVETRDMGTLKVGQIWKRFGLDWDGSFWGNTQYFDGFKLNPDLGVSWENTVKCGDEFKVDTFTQFFVTQDGVNGSAGGGDSESQPGSSRHNTGVVRAVPTWTFGDKSTLALGFSGMVGEIRNQPYLLIGNKVLAAWALDATYQSGHWKLFADVTQANGTLNPTRYVSGGPSQRVTDVLLGAQYVIGPATLRFAYSTGFDENPSGWQSLWVPGVTVALTKNVDFYAEYVRWDVYNTVAGTHHHSVFEDGVQLVINWRF